MNTIHVTSENFKKEVLESKGKVLVDFWATWCGPCRMQAPILEEVAQIATDTKVCKVNIDEQVDLAQQFKVMSIPTLVVLENGKVVNSFVGVKSKNELLQILGV